MGLFSFITNDTRQSIPNRYSDKEPLTVYMINNNGDMYTEIDYEGYGVFGGKDFYIMLAEMNGVKGEDHEELRDRGIDLYFDTNDCLCPMIVEDPRTPYNKYNRIKPCPVQGS